MKLFYIILFFLFTCFATAQEPFWVQMDVSTGGRLQTNCLKQRGDTLYLGTSSGLYRSTDAAENWELISRGQFKQLYITSQHYLLARIIIQSTSYIIKSYDYGITWDTLALASYFCPEAHESWNRIEEFVVDNDDNMYISFNNRSMGCENREGIYRSGDLGENWEKIDTLFHYSRISAYDSNHFSISLLKLFTYPRDSALVKITKDGGKTYKIIEGEYERMPSIRYLDSNRMLMANYNMFYSSDGGDNWEIFNPKPKEMNSFYSQMLFVNDSSFYVWACGDRHTVGIIFYYTNDFGNTWERISQDTLIMGDATASGDLQFFQDSIIISTHDFGVSKSIDGGKHFELKNKGYYNFNTFHKLEFDRYGNVYLGCASDLFISRDNGISWEKYKNSSLGFNKLFEAPNGDMLWEAGDWLGQTRLLRSKDQGRHWDTVQTNFGSFSAVRKAPNGNMYTFFPFLKSTDNGDTWGDRKDPDIKYLNSQLTGLVNNKNELFVADNEDTIYRSQDEGDTWKAVNKCESTGSGIWCGIFIPKTDIGHCISDHHRATTDNGETWFKVPFQFENHVFNSMVMDSLGNLWAGIYKSTDYGFTWQAVSSGLELGSETKVMQMGVNANGYVFIGLSNRGLYRSRIPFIDPAKYEENYTLEQDYAIFPNPAEDYLFINDNNSYSQDRIRIFSAAGVEVLASAFTRQLDISLLPAGVYYLKIGLKHFRFVKV